MFTAVLMAHLLLLGVWWVAQCFEKRYRRWKLKVNRALRSSGLRDVYTTHTTRFFSWSPPSLSSFSFWVSVCPASLFLIWLYPSMPPPPLPSHPPQALIRSHSGLHLPQTSSSSPQYFDPPRRDRVYWLENLGTVVSRTARTSWDLISINLSPKPRIPTSTHHHPMLTAHLAADPMIRASIHTAGNFWAHSHLLYPQLDVSTHAVNTVHLSSLAQPVTQQMHSKLDHVYSGIVWQPTSNLRTIPNALVLSNSGRAQVLPNPMSVQSALALSPMHMTAQPASALVMLHSPSSMCCLISHILVQPTTAPAAVLQLLSPSSAAISVPQVTTAVAVWACLNLAPQWVTCPAEVSSTVVAVWTPLILPPQWVTCLAELSSTAVVVWTPLILAPLWVTCPAELSTTTTAVAICSQQTFAHSLSTWAPELPTTAVALWSPLTFPHQQDTCPADVTTPVMGHSSIIGAEHGDSSSAMANWPLLYRMPHLAGAYVTAWYNMQPQMSNTFLCSSFASCFYSLAGIYTGHQGEPNIETISNQTRINTIGSNNNSNMYTAHEQTVSKAPAGWRQLLTTFRYSRNHASAPATNTAAAQALPEASVSEHFCNIITGACLLTLFPLHSGLDLLRACHCSSCSHIAAAEAVQSCLHSACVVHLPNVFRLVVSILRDKILAFVHSSSACHSCI